ncbi:hypothetical protein Tco_0246648 [Tanacetum coccineum]
METKDIKSLCSDSEEHEMQQMQKQAKSMKQKFNTFKSTLVHHMDNLAKQLNTEVLHEKDSKSALSVIKVNDTDIRPFDDREPMAEVPNTIEYNVFAVKTQHTEQPENMNDTSLNEKVDSNTTPDSSDMCNNEIKADQNADDYEDDCVMLANLIENLKFDTDENKKI